MIPAVVAVYASVVLDQEERVREVNGLTVEEREASAIPQAYREFLQSAMVDADLDDSPEAWAGVVVACSLVQTFIDATMHARQGGLAHGELPDHPKMTPEMLAGAAVTILATVVNVAVPRAGVA